MNCDVTNEVGLTQNPRDKVGCFALTILIYEKIIYQALAYIGAALGFDYASFSDTFLYITIILAFVVFFSLTFLNRGQKTLNIGVLLILMIVLIYYIYTTNNLNLDFKEKVYDFDIKKLLFLYLPGMIMMASVKDFGTWLESLKYTNVFMTIISIYTFLGRNSQSSGDEKMVIAYMFALCAVITIFMIKSNILKRLNIALLVLDILFIFGSGTRGAFVVLLSYLAICLIRKILAGENVNKKIVKIIITVFWALILVFLYDYLIEMLANLLRSIGFSTRITDSLTSGGFSESAGRVLIQDTLISHLADLPFLGFGILADRYLTGGLYYAHNLELEFILDFGWYVGILLLAMMLLSLIQNLKDSQKRELVLILICYTVIHLQISVSYLTEGSFWVLLGVLCSDSINTRRRIVWKI